MDIKTGDRVCAKETGDLEWVVVEMPGYSRVFPDDYLCLDENDGMFGLIAPGEITHVNGEVLN